MKKTVSVSVAIFAIVVIGMVSCAKQSEDLLQPSSGNQCDTTSVKYSTSIVQILQNNCYECHGASSNGGSGGIVLEGYANLKKWADNGFLIGNVTHAPGYVAMPYGRAKLPDCEVNTIVAWVNQGSLNN